MPPAAANRNDPCPCGSGRKYKQCCLRKEGSPRSAPTAAAPPPGHQALLKQAAEHHRAGRLAMAVMAYEAVLRQRPRHTAALLGLSEIKGRLGEPEQAIDLLRRVLAAEGPGRPEHHLRLAAMLDQVGRLDEALEVARRAAAAEPASARAHGLIARCLQRTNRLKEAVSAAEKALGLDPDDTAVSITRAILHRRQGEPEQARQRLERVVARERDPARRSHALHELGTVLDGLGRYDEAWEAFCAGGAEDRRSPAAARIGLHLERDHVAMHRRGMTGELLSRFAAPSRDDGRRPPAFLVGFPRSGTTMTEQIMAAHGEVVTVEERPLLHAVITEIGAAEDLPGALSRLDHGRLASLRSTYWAAAEAATGTSLRERVFVDKLPMNIVELGVINAVFPDARVIVALRDPRDVCLSCFMQFFQLNPAMIHFTTLEGTAALYEQVMDLWLHLRGIVTVKFVEVRYEDTVRDLEGQARQILEILGATWDPAVLAFHERARRRAINTPSAAAVTEPVHTRAIGRWRNYEKHFEPVLPRLERFVKEFGYE